jgi:DNA-binding PucR family transcriptional regulator
MLMSPRFLFAGLLGFGLIGVALSSWVGGTLLLAAAIAGGIAVERLLVAPLWKLSMRFASNPAVMLESATFAEATVVSNFDRNGEGIIAVEVDGQVQQILATLSAADRARGARIRAGEVVRVDEVDPVRHRCVVSTL